MLRFPLALLGAFTLSVSSVYSDDLKPPALGFSDSNQTKNEASPPMALGVPIATADETPPSKKIVRATAATNNGPSQLPLPTSGGILGAPLAIAQAAPLVPGSGFSSAPTYRVWGGVEYLLWSSRSMAIPPLVTTGTSPNLGELGNPGTRVLAGGNIPFSLQSGARVTLGMWFDSCQRCGLEGNFFYLGQRSEESTFASNGDPVLSRPIFNTLTGTPGVEQVANPADLANNVLPLTGRVRVSASTSLVGGELNLLANCCQISWCGMRIRLDGLAGFRYLQLQEDLRIQENLLVPATSPILGGTNFLVVDDFQTRNHFYGSQIGARLELQRGGWFLDLTGKAAMGINRQQVSINGSTTIDDPLNPPRMTYPGGLLALSSNIGNYERNVFSIVPEVGVNMGYSFHDRVRIFGGYNFLYWTNVVRPGDQIDLRVNPNLVPLSPGGSPDPRLPSFSFRNSEFWANGVSFGMEIRY